LVEGAVGFLVDGVFVAVDFVAVDFVAGVFVDVALVDVVFAAAVLVETDFVGVDFVDSDFEPVFVVLDFVAVFVPVAARLVAVAVLVVDASGCLAGGSPAGVMFAFCAAARRAATTHWSVVSSFSAGNVPALTNFSTGSQSHVLLDASSAECPFRQCRTSELWLGTSAITRCASAIGNRSSA